MDRLTDVAVVDPRDGSITTGPDVWIADGRITGLRNTAGPGDDPATVDGRGRFVVPGFVDMHAHPLNLPDPSYELGLMLAFGITGYRQMSGTSELLRRRREGAFGGPQAPQLLGLPGEVLTVINAGKPATAVAEVRQQARDAALEATRDAIDSFDEAKTRESARQFAADGTWNCPTLIRVKERRTWAAAADAFHRNFDDTQRAVFADQFALQLRIVKILDEEGAPLLAGTDAVGAAWAVAGASRHDEFDLLAQAGLSALRILQTATIDPAVFLGRDKQAGTVEPGKEADLVLLDADPTTTPAHLHTVSAVIRAGHHHSPGDLATLRTR